MSTSKSPAPKLVKNISFTPKQKIQASACNFYRDLYLGCGNIEVELGRENTVSAKRFGVVFGRRRSGRGGHGSGAKPEREFGRNEAQSQENGRFNGDSESTGWN